MNFAGIGPAELLVILIIALLIFGPTKLPEIARDLGGAIQKWRRALDEITEDTLSQAPSSPSKEADMQAAVQKVVPGEQKSDDTTVAQEETETTEVESECQT